MTEDHKLLINILAPDGETGRKERGAFYTPDGLALAICRSLRDRLGIAPRTVLEPGCGGGAFLRAADSIWPESSLEGIDLLPACSGPGLVSKMNVFDWSEPVDLIVGNPDYSKAEETVRHCLPLLNDGGCLAFLLRLAFLAGQKRADLYERYPLYALQPIAGRPSFTDGGTDSSEYGLFVWKRSGGRLPILPPLRWSK
jgi:hypothetical protein